MKCGRLWAAKLNRIMWFVQVVWLAAALNAKAAMDEQTFPLLQIGTTTYTNVTVTSKTATHVFLVHSAGMQSFKVASLPWDVRQKLGYVVAEKPKAPTNAASAWSKQTLGKIETPQVKQLEAQWGARLKLAGAKDLPARWQALVPLLRYGILAGVALGYLLSCYAAMLICQKTGHPAGVLVWVPGLQMLPLFRAAGMSGWWFLALFVPLLNLVAGVLWSLKIAPARGKSIWVGVLLLLPALNVVAFFYLAFSSGKAPEPEKAERRAELMTLDVS